jgi:hypothetical protein
MLGTKFSFNKKKRSGNRLLHFKVSEMLQKQRIVTDG